MVKACRYCVSTVLFESTYFRLIHEIQVHDAPVPDWLRNREKRLQARTPKA
jgi:hypothetical protein